MSIRLRCPTHDALGRLAERSAHEQPTYAPVGVTKADRAPAGYRFDRWSAELGDGDMVFDRAAEAIRQWLPHSGAGLKVSVDEPPSVGLVVAMAAPLPLGYIEAVCRVVDVIDAPDRYGFAYGTLPVHPEQGEESFVVTRRDDGQVTFDIVAVSRTHHLLARAFPPVARQLQRAAVKRYLSAMTRVVGV